MPPEVRFGSCVAFSKEINEAHDAFVVTNSFANETEIYKAVDLVFRRARHMIQSAHEVEGPYTAFIAQMLPLRARNSAIRWPEQQLRLPLDLMPSFNFHGEALVGGKFEDHPSQTGFGVGHIGLFVPPAVMAATFSSTSGTEGNSLQGSRKVNNRNLTISSAAQLPAKNISSKATLNRSVNLSLVESPAIRSIQAPPLPPSRDPGACFLASATNTPLMQLGPFPATLTSHGTFHTRGRPQPEAPSIRKWINSRAMKNFKRASVNNLFRQMGRTFREEPYVDRSMPIYEHMFGQLKSAATETANENCTDERAQKVLYNVMSQFRRHQGELWPAKDLFQVQDRGPIEPTYLIVPNVHSQKRTRGAYSQAAKFSPKQIAQTQTQQPVHESVNQPLQDTLQLPAQQSMQQARRRHTNHPEIASRNQPGTLSPAQMVAQYLQEKYNIPPSNAGTPTGYPETLVEDPVTTIDDSEEKEDAGQGSDSNS